MCDVYVSPVHTVVLNIYASVWKLMYLDKKCIKKKKLLHKSTISTNFIRTKMAKKDSYDADKEDDKRKHFNKKRGRERRSLSALVVNFGKNL